MDNNTIQPDTRGQNNFNHPLLPVLSNDDLAREVEIKGRELEAMQYRPGVSGLAAYIDTCWQAAKLAKVEIEEELLKCLRQRKGEYDPSDLAIIRQAGGAEIYMMITSVKCRAIESAIKDILGTTSGDRAWAIKPTPVPDTIKHVDEMADQQLQMEMHQLQAVNPEAMPMMTEEIVKQRRDAIKEKIEQEIKKNAQNIAEKQEDYIDDIFQEGGWSDAIDEFVKDFSTYPAAFLCGPEVRSRKKLQWQEDKTGNFSPVAVTQLVRELRRVSPFDIFPSPGAKHLDDGYLIERRIMRIRDLLACKGVPGFKDSAIDGVILTMGTSTGATKSEWLWTDEERKELENRPHEEVDAESSVEAIIFNGYVQGLKLVEWGMDRESIPNLTEEYHVVCMKVNSWVVMARLNDHPLGWRGYYSASYESNNDSIWGKGPPQMMRDCARICNAAARAAVNNMGFSATPQIEIDIDRIDPEEEIENIYPGKIWKTHSDLTGRTNTPAVNFNFPPMVAERLMEIFNRFYMQAGEQVGVPAYEHGSSQTQGAGQTARGLSMLMSASSKIIKDAVRNIDRKIIIKAVEATWVHLLMYDALPIGGDIKIVARASEYMMMFDTLQQLRREWLQITNNPTDMAIIGFKGRASVLRETAKSLRLPVDDIIPSQAEIDRQMQMAAQQEQMAAQQEQEQEESNSKKPEKKAKGKANKEAVPMPNPGPAPRPVETGMMM